MKNANKHIINITNEYFNAFTYDVMGNILTQQRHNRAGGQFDNLSYQYQKDANGNLERNRLYHVNDAVSAGFDSTDIDDMGTFVSAIESINTDNNYVYDKEGRLVKDRQEEIDTILWTVTGKVSEIRRSDTSHKKNLKFNYDSFGRRIAKHVYNNETAMLEKSTYYILDAQGNQLSIYEHRIDTNSAKYYLAERNIYGSSRLGSANDTINMFVPNILPSYGIMGNRTYELSNHLGNVLTTISDIKYPLSNDNISISGYEVGINGISDYSPFGAPLEGRTVGRLGKYGYGGHEKVNEVSGIGNYYGFGDYGLDVRLARRWQPDSKAHEYPFQSSYSVFNGNPIYFVDPDGKDGIASVRQAELIIKKSNKVIEGGTLKNPHEMTIKANYYYNAETISSIGGTTALNSAIKAYNSSDYVVKGVDGQYYKVSFEISAIPVNEITPVDIYRNHVDADKIQGLPFGNLLGTDIPNFNDRLDKNELGAASSRSISLKTSSIKDAVSQGANMEITLFNMFIHEIGHNLGGAHEDGGAMNQNVVNEQTNIGGINTASDYVLPAIKYSTQKNRLTKGNVQAIVNTVWEGGHEEGRPGQVQQIK